MILTNLLTRIANDQVNVLTDDKNPLPHVGAGNDQIHTIVNIVLGIAGSLALLFIVIGGLRYILSQGDPNGVARARDTVIYALVGLVITMTAYGIITFVVNRI
jgi:hypothetical protein